ncbi:uncharacterized protein LOC135115041 [Scylla paramamosain]|uniref:uncharacterized protein LOC135115041 n=1 Tax=Scylla paramamosain TaxID=85552 RepID=UPI003082EB5C
MRSSIIQIESQGRTVGGINNTPTLPRPPLYAHASMPTLLRLPATPTLPRPLTVHPVDHTHAFSSRSYATPCHTLRHTPRSTPRRTPRRTPAHRYPRPVMPFATPTRRRGTPRDGHQERELRVAAM